MASKSKRAIRKVHINFLLFHFWDLKLVPNDSALNSVWGKWLIFFKNVGIVPRKAAKIENPVKFFLKCRLLSIAEKLENVGTKMFLQIYKILSNFGCNLSICEKFLAKIAQILQIVIAFFPASFSGKRKGYWVLILTYLNSPIAEVFPHYCLSFITTAIFKRKTKTGGQSFFFMKTQILQFFFQTIFLFARVLPLLRMSAKLDHILGSKVPKSSQKGSFHGCCIGVPNFENLTTTIAILMKLTTIMYLHESVNRKLLRSRNSVFCRNVY